MQRIITIFLSFLFAGNIGIIGQEVKESEAHGCYAIRSGNHLVLGNQLIERHYRWNNGHIISESLYDKIGDRSLFFNDTIPDLYLPGETMISSSGSLKMEAVERSAKWEKHLRIEIITQLNDLEVKRVFRIFPATRAFQCQFFFRGKTNSSWIKDVAEEGEHLNKIQPYSDGNKGF